MHRPTKHLVIKCGSAAIVAAILSGVVACATCPLESAARARTPKPSEPSPPSSSPPSDPVPSAAFDHRRALALPSLARTLGESFSIGVAIELHHIADMQDIVAHHFNRITAENAMKMGPLCPSPQCSFATADQIAQFARQHHMAVNGHTFVWHRMHPDWVFKDGSGQASKETVSARLREHIFTLTERYADVVDNWDVVNEAISDAPDKMYRDAAEGSKWYAAFGNEEYIKVAFEHAARAAETHDPTVKLFYNDYGVVDPVKRKKIIQMVRWLRAEGVRVDGVGMQAHWNLEWPTADAIRTAIDELAAEQLEVKISELDISIYTKDDYASSRWEPEGESAPELDRRLVARYSEVFQVLLEKRRHLAHVTLWGVDDGRSWLNTWPVARRNHPLLFDRDHQPKPALEAILTLVPLANDEKPPALEPAASPPQAHPPR